MRFIIGAFVVGILVLLMFVLRKKVRWIDEEDGKIRGTTFAFISTYLFLSMLFLGMMLDFVADAWIKMGEWFLYGWGALTALYTGVDITKVVTGFGLKKAEILSKVQNAVSNKP
jgi:cytochrome b561